MTRAVSMVCCGLSLACAAAPLADPPLDWVEVIRETPVSTWFTGGPDVQACTEAALTSGDAHLMSKLVERLSHEPRDLSPTERDRLIERLVASDGPEFAAIRWLGKTRAIDGLTRIAERSGLPAAAMADYCLGQPPPSSERPDSKACIASAELDDVCRLQWEPACGIRGRLGYCAVADEGQGDAPA